MTSSPKIYDPNAGQRSNLINTPPQGLGPPSTSSNLGSAAYNNGNYTFNSNTGQQDAQTTALARTAYNSALGVVNNPQEGQQNAVNTYGAYMRPAFQQQQNIDMGQAIAGLGNQYQSTYGQLTLNQKANQEAVANAQNEQNIYNAGQTWYNQQVSNANTLGQGYNTARQAEMDPYTTIQNQLIGAQNSVGAYNTYLANIYGTQMAGAGNHAFQETPYNPIAQILGAAASTAGQAAGAGA